MTFWRTDLSLALEVFWARTARASESVVPEERSVESWRVVNERSWTETPLPVKSPPFSLASATSEG